MPLESHMRKCRRHCRGQRARGAVSACVATACVATADPITTEAGEPRPPRGAFNDRESFGERVSLGEPAPALAYIDAC